MMKCIVLITILISLAHVTRGVHLRSKINAVKTLKNNVQIEQNVQNTQNVYTSNAHRVGGWGGLCTCPDGRKYYVGDNYDSCRSLACVNGHSGQCHRRGGPWSRRKVTCGSAAPANIAEGLYKIKTTHHGPGRQPAGWGLSAWNAHGARRNSASSWVHVHDGETWPMVWKIVKGKKPNTYRLLTTHHGPGRQPAGWGLSAWNAHDARRNSGSSWTAVHNGDYWPMDWQIVKGAK